MKTTRNRDLGEKLRVLDAPGHRDQFWQRLDAALAGASQESAGRRQAALRRWLRPSLAAAVALAACVALALALTGLPGNTTFGPAPAGAVGRLLAAVDAGLAKVQTLQGTMLTEDAQGQHARMAFAATSGGDVFVDQPLPVTPGELRIARQTYTQERASMRAGDQPWDRARLRLDRTVWVRRQWAGDATSRVSTGRVWLIDAFTRRAVGISYYRETHSDGRFVEIPSPATADAANVWGVSAAVRVAIAAHPAAVALTDTRYDGRPATRAVLTIAGRRWVAVIDRQYGLVLSFAPQDGTAASAGAGPYEAFRIVALRVNQPVRRSRFTVPPVFSLDTAYRAIPLGRHDPRPYTSDDGSVTMSVPAAVRSGEAAILLPTWLPRGFRLWPTASSFSMTTSLWFVRGLDSVQLGISTPSEYAQRDRRTWINLSADSPAASQGAVIATRGGALDGWPMRLAVPELYDPRSADWHNAGVDESTSDPEVSLRGVLTRQQFVDIIASLRPSRGWGLFDRPAYQYARLLLLATIALVLAALAVELGWRRHAPHGLRLPELVALAGCVALAVSMWLPWYRLESVHWHVHYELAGGSIDFAVGALACAFGAALIALLRATRGGWGLPARESILLAVFGLVALAFVADARLVQPDQARFVLGDPGTGVSVWPTPWIGLLVGFVGVAAILIAALLARSPRPADGGEVR